MKEGDGMFNFDLKTIGRALVDDGWYRRGVHFLVDGQYGSSGKGAAAALLVKTGFEVDKSFDVFMTNAGCNSGHTAWVGDEQIITRQLPVGAVTSRKLRPDLYISTYLTAGAVIRPEILEEEIRKFGVDPLVHPCAAIIEDKHVEQETSDGSSRVAGTGKGVGAALADKVRREGNLWKIPGRIGGWPNEDTLFNNACLHESAQGFSLGVNDPLFAPHTTSRECTVQQAMADARIPVSCKRQVMLTMRTFSIRVGNTDQGYSGDCYPDQQETSWEELGVEPELTTVTKRVRRVFTWSWRQFHDAIRVNEPDALYVSFLDYLPEDRREPFVAEISERFEDAMGYEPTIIGAFGPKSEDAALWVK
jgi:adenylosuccinate synthase